MDHDGLDLENLIYHGREERNIEFKRDMPWDGNPTKAKITKSILGMSNLRDGGDIVIGVQDGTFVPDGMTDLNFNSWNQDHLLNHVAEYSDPPVEAYLHKHELNQLKFVVIHVPEFRDIPTICKKGYSDILVNGTIYTRSKTKKETRAVESQNEMRDIIELATEKGIRTLMSRVGNAGFMVGDRTPTDQELFEGQLNGF